MCQVTLCRSGWYMTSELTKKSRGAIRERVAPRRAFGAKENGEGGGVGLPGYADRVARRLLRTTGPYPRVLYGTAERIPMDPRAREVDLMVLCLRFRHKIISMLSLVLCF